MHFTGFQLPIQIQFPTPIQLLAAQFYMNVQKSLVTQICK